MSNAISLPGWPYIAPDEIAAVSEVLKSGKINYWTGNLCKQFEKEFAEYVGAEYAISLANGTLALELALHVLPIKAGDEVIVPSKTFIATASAVIACGATPVIADIDLDSQNISATTIAPCITPKTKAIIVVHMGGLSCDMDPIIALAKQHNLIVIEDCAQAHGAQYKGKMVGNLADVALFSFCQDKIMTTGGEGGMLVTNNQQLWRRAWEYKDHGKDYDAVHDNSNGNSGFKWLHNSFGSNYRLTEMQAAIGIAQLHKLNQWVTKRRSNAKILLVGLAQIPGLKVHQPDADYFHSYYKFYFTVDLQRLKSGWNRNKISAALNEIGIPAREGTCSEIYREQAFKKLGLSPQQPLKNAQQLSENSLMLPVHPTLEAEHMQSMLLGLKQVMQSATI